jgi:serine/threonine-protein kinase HipA
MSTVFTNRKTTGTLSREKDDTFGFIYNPGNPPENIVSLTMPVATGPFLTDTPTLLHPAFAANLPEGILRLTIEDIFKKALPDMDNLTLLEITGRSQIGRVRVAPAAEKLETAPKITLDELLQIQGTQEYHRHLVKTYGRHSGISGMQPKILARISGTTERTTTEGNTHIVKLFDPNEYPALALNEFLCMTAAKKAGLTIPELQLSRDHSRLIVRRFDTNPDGSFMALEDCCALDNLQPNAKYLGSYEDIAVIIRKNISFQNKKTGMEEFFTSLTLSTILRNGDAHRKNFSLTYNHPNDIKFSPTYDIVTTTAYIHKDVMALRMNGTKQWPTKKDLEYFGQNSCGLSPQECATIMDKVQTATSEALETLRAMLPETLDHTSRTTLRNMETAWETGIKSLQPSTTQIPFDTKRTNHPERLHNQKPPEKNPTSKSSESLPHQNRGMNFDR